MYLLADFAFVPMTTEKYSKVLKQWGKISKKLEPDSIQGKARRSILDQLDGTSADRLTFLKKQQTNKAGKKRNIVTGIADIDSNDIGDSIVNKKELGKKAPSEKYLVKTDKDVRDKDGSIKGMLNQTHTVNDLVGNPKALKDKRFKGATKSLQQELINRKIPDYDKINIHPIDESGTKLYGKYLGRPENKDSFLMREVRDRKKVQ